MPTFPKPCPALRAAADTLLGAGRWHVPRRWGRPLVTFPSGAAEWDLPVGGAWHNDFVPLQAKAGLRAVQFFVVLADLPPRGGGTLVLAGSHHLVDRYLAGSGVAPHPRHLRRVLDRHPWLRDLWDPPASSAPEERIRRFMTGGARVGDVDLRVVELTGSAGDAYVMHCDTFHAVAPNCHTEPRMMATNILVRAEPEATSDVRSLS